MDVKNHLVFLLIIIIFISCSKDEPNSPVEPGSTSTGTFTAEIGPIKWEAETVRAYKQGVYTRIDGTQQIPDLQNKYSSIVIYIDILHLKEPKLFGIGEDGGGLNYSAHTKIVATLRTDDSEDTFFGQYIENFSLLNVTAIDERHIRGDFQFRGYTKDNPPDSLNVINGSFNIKF